MRIGLTIDALSPRPTGIGRYVRELAARLCDCHDIESLSFFRSDQWTDEFNPFLKPERKNRFRWPRTFRRLQMRKKFRRRLIHGSNYFLPQSAELGVITVHDLSVLLYPDTHPAERVLQFERNFQYSLDKASHIICDSYAVRDELLTHMPLSPDRVSAIHLGVSDGFRPYSAFECAGVRREVLGENIKDYILCVATLEPRKRIEQAIIAHAHAWGRGKITAPLVLVGANGWKDDNLHKLIDRQQRRGSVIVPGWVAEEQLPALYSGASLFVYPSIYEGFGLPPIEAMACGTPVIVSNRSCFPEVTAGAALEIDPDDITSFAFALERGLNDEEWRAEAVRKGKDVASRYTWDQCAAQTVDVYKKVWNETYPCKA